MKYGLLLTCLLLSACALQPPHLAQAPRPARHQYQHAQRHNTRVRPHLQPFYLSWN
ncbi:MAG: hypothetical protein ACRYF0_09450 [Janthinobacterium lividum]